MAAKRIKIDNASSKFRRQSQKREQKVIRCSVLIVCEGTKTEPNYFEAFALHRLQNICPAKRSCFAPAEPEL